MLNLNKQQRELIKGSLIWKNLEINHTSLLFIHLLGLEYYQAYLESDCIDLSRNFIVDSKVVAKIWIAKRKRKKVSFLIMEVSQ